MNPQGSKYATAYYAPTALRSCRYATTSHARRWLRSTPSMALRQLKLFIFFSITRYRSQLRKNKSALPIGD